MHQQTLKAIVAELETQLPGCVPGKSYQLSPASVALDFHLRQGFLFISVEPAAPRLYLMKRSGRELDRKAISPSPFLLAFSAELGDAPVHSITKDESERIVRFHFSTSSESIAPHITTMVAQLTGRSANLFLLSDDGIIVHALRRPHGDGQQVNDKYQPPPQSATASSREPIITADGFRTMSEAADNFYRQVELENEFKATAAKLKDQLRRETAKRKKLRTNLEKDLVGHGDPAEHKRLGDLLLANIGNEKRAGDTVKVTDYYEDSQPTIEIKVDENKTLQEAAAEAFSRYGKAKRALEEIKERLASVDRELEELAQKQERLDAAILAGDAELLQQFVPAEKKNVARAKSKSANTVPGARRYKSSDGYEVLVGRTARDNDNLTFRVARPNDLWLHAGDYPGSHVIVRNASRREIPQRTVIEAAQLAAKFSQAGNDSKVNVHYTPRKFLAKPKGAAPGLVRMSSFKSITVTPAENLERVL